MVRIHLFKIVSGFLGDQGLFFFYLVLFVAMLMLGDRGFIL